jgi:aldehyde dehydrogenase (NAD+)
MNDVRAELTCRIGQACVAGSRIYLQEGIYDEFLAKFTKVAQELTAGLGGPFDKDVKDGPLMSQVQFDVRRNVSSCRICS